MTINTPLIAVILSGGTGSRLWPVSRESHPKPFIQLADHQTLLQKTFQRACNLASVAEVMTITNKEYYLKSKAEYEKNSHKPVTTFILEPFARNTAPAIALAALKIAKQYGNDAIMLILPADHLITDTAAFAQQCELACRLASTESCLVTFGIRPTHPETGFGYIECGAAKSGAHQVKRFVEKPNATTAQSYIDAGNYLWNAGMFCFKAGVILDELAAHAPDLLKQAMATAENNPSFDQNVTDITDAHFNSMPSISIDYAVMEKSDNIMVLACDFGWHDIGSWEAYKQIHQADQSGNTVFGEAILIDSQNNLVHSETRMVASIGINNLAIIDTPDALLITHRDRAQDVKDIVKTLKDQSHDSYHTHRTVMRPWGHYTVLEESAHYKIKRIVVHPGAALSLQYHQHRAEHWVVIAGKASVVNGDKEYTLQANESAFVPMGTVHRLSNREDIDLIIIEVQTGNYVGEDDIIRMEDTYGRIK